MRTKLKKGDKVICVSETLARHEKAHLFKELPRPGFVYCVQEVDKCEQGSYGVKLVGIKCRRDEGGSKWLFNETMFRRIPPSSERSLAES